MITLGLLGSSGRMGRWVTELVNSDYAGKAIVSASVHRGQPLVSLLGTQVVIDFSSPEAMIALAKAAIAQTNNLPAFVIGSTGWTQEQRALIEQLAKLTPVVMSANFSVGVQLLLHILRGAAPGLLALGYQPSLIETHHTHKKDAPSGTALAIVHAVTPAGSPHPLQIHSIRAGEVIGDHEVTFYGAGDQIVIGHHAQDRSIFARGAIDVALWLSTQPAAAQNRSGILGLDAFLRSNLPI